MDFPEIQAALRVRNWSRAAGLYALLTPEEKNDPAGKLLLAELRIGQGEAAYQGGDLFKAREFYREAYGLWPGHPLVYRRYHELMALDLTRPQKRPVAQTPPKPLEIPTPPPVDAPEEPTVQIIVIQGERRMILSLPAEQIGVPGGPSEKKGPSFFEGGLLGLLLLTNLQLMLLLRRRVTRIGLA